MRSKVRTIDPSLDLGLHELANSGEGRARPDGSFRFQLKFAKEQTEDILLNLDNLVKNTIDKAPVRTKDFCLDRTTAPELTHEEDKWEREMYLKWGPRGSGEYVSVCKRIQAYQYPLQASRKDRCWGKIDLPVTLPISFFFSSRRFNSIALFKSASSYGIGKSVKGAPGQRITTAPLITSSPQSEPPLSSMSTNLRARLSMDTSIRIPPTHDPALHTPGFTSSSRPWNGADSSMGSGFHGTISKPMCF